MGHGSARAAMIYQHATKQRDKTIADALSATIAAERDRARNGHEPSQQINQRKRPRSANSH
jgi:hypothetical protein